MCVRVFVHVGHANVIVSARTPLYMMCGYVTRRGRGLVYKVLQGRPRSQCVVVMAVSDYMLAMFVQYR